MDESLSSAIDIAVSDRDGERVSLRLSLQREVPPGTTLHFCLAREIEPDTVQGAALVRQSGSYKELALEPGSRRIGISCQLIERLTDLPQGFYLCQPHGSPLPLSVRQQDLALPAAEKKTEPPQASLRPVAGIVPAPQLCRAAEGCLSLPEIITVEGPKEAIGVSDVLARLTGLSLREAQGRNDAPLLVLEQAALDEEAYRLDIAPSGVRIEAAGCPGWRHGLASLAQWSLQHGKNLPCLTVEDRPRFGFRGLMLDCARHFFPPSVIMRLLDQMALYKLNRFHWHLTDDEGWRLEIKAFPELTEIGAWRGHALPVPPLLSGGPAPYGGFYSRQDVRKVLDHAAHLGIEVIPEIDVPAHCYAAIQSLPALLAEAGDVSRYRSCQNFYANTLNPALPGTFLFLEKVLEEVCALFPSRWIHLGGDEVPEGVWSKSPACRALGDIGPQGLKDRLLHHCLRLLEQKGKSALGWWEEIVERETPLAGVGLCSWSGAAPGLKAAALGYPVVMAPAQHLYLDLAYGEDHDEPGLYWAGPLDLRRVHQYDPAPEGILGRDNIQGVLCALWSELIASRERLDYMVFPRLAAVAEVAWSMPENKHWDDFRARLPGQLKILDRMGIAYRKTETFS